MNSMMTARYQAMNDAMDALSEEGAEHSALYDDGRSVQDEPFDLASEIAPTECDKFMPNDGTPAVERRLRKQGFRKADDSQRDEVQSITVEVFKKINGRVYSARIHVLRQPTGDKVL